MTISLFVVQGSQTQGMGKDIYDAFPKMADLYDTASEILGRDMKQICFEAPIEELSKTINAQPAIRRCVMPVRVRIHSSFVSRNFAKSSFVIIFSGR